jgi:O-methyltransferase involved in polyketide biosynthesis
MNDISNTALITLKCHVLDANRPEPVLNDLRSLIAFQYLNNTLDEENKKILQTRLRKSLVKHTVLRAKKYDDYVIRFLHKHPEALVVNIGCGLDHRFSRIDNGTCKFLDLDLPDIINIKKNIFPSNGRYLQIGQSVFDLSWLNGISANHVLLLAEGVFMYCPEKDVRALFHEIHTKIPGAEFVFEVFSSKWLTGLKKLMVDFKLRKQLKFGKDATFQFGIADSDEIEHWSEHFKLLEDWSYFDVIKPNAKDSLRKIQWTVHYKL